MLSELSLKYRRSQHEVTMAAIAFDAFQCSSTFVPINRPFS